MTENWQYNKNKPNEASKINLNQDYLNIIDVQKLGEAIIST